MKPGPPCASFSLGDLGYKDGALDRSGGRIRSSLSSRRGTMGKKSGGEVTSSKVASKAGQILSNPKSSAAAKSVAASALTQAANKGKKGK